MRWRGRRQSSNIEDRRGAGGGFGRGGFGGGLGGFRIPMGRGRGRVGRRAGLGGFGFIILIVIAVLMGFDPSMLLTGGAGPGSTDPVSYPSQSSSSSGPDPLRDFVAVVLADTEDVWNAQFRQQLNAAYQEPNLVLFRDGVRSACGTASSAVGPFYCPGDRKVYLDLGFFQELTQRFGAPGDFAQAYVIAHEVGHHVQNLLGISGEVRNAQRGRSEAEVNALSVMLELQADCLAGFWAHHAQSSKQILEAGDIDEALGAASAIGDDTLQRQGRGYVTPDSFTHGTSEQRQRWFKRGFEQGSLDACDTFSASAL